MKSLAPVIIQRDGAFFNNIESCRNLICKLGNDISSNLYILIGPWFLWNIIADKLDVTARNDFLQKRFLNVQEFKISTTQKTVNDYRYILLHYKSYILFFQSVSSIQQ